MAKYQDPKLYNVLAVMIEKGEGHPYDFEKIGQYYQLAMNAGDPYGTLNYGNYLFQMGNFSQAYQIIEKASKMSLPDGSQFVDAKLAMAFLNILITRRICSFK